MESIAGSACGVGMNDDDETNESGHAGLRLKLSGLRVEHQDLDSAVSALESKPMPDQIQIARLKKKKLALRDAISQLEDLLTPDIIA